jgi:PAS domain S-box-containing protein
VSYSLDVFVGLTQNVGLLLSLLVLHGAMRRYTTRGSAIGSSLANGVLFGLVAIVGMHVPISVASGVIADARYIPLALAGSFGGFGTAAVAGTLAGTYRVWLGGVGAAAGVGLIVTAVLLGAVLSWRRGGRSDLLRLRDFLMLGIALDASGLAWALALPSGGLAREVLAVVVLPVGLLLPLGTVAVGTLLVQQVRRDAERERLALTQFTVDHAAEAIVRIDATGRLVDANPAAIQLLGYSYETLLSLHLWDLDAEMTRHAWPALWRRVRTARTLTTESRYRAAAGHIVPVEISSGFLADGAHEWLTVFARDISERKHAETERARSFERERSLRRAAEEASVLKDQFLATLSHELRTPLTSVLGYARMLRTGTLTERAATRALEVIERNAKAQARIVDDLLDVSAIVMGTLTLERRPVLLNEVVDDAVHALAPAAVEAGVDLWRDTSTPARVDGDADRLRQVVRNVVGNAIKFTPRGGRVTVRLDIGVDAGARVVVSDTGDGIDSAFLPHVFEQFRQADGSATRSHEGLGLGLTIARHLVELHGGTIHAASDGCGRGATFTVVLPLAHGRREAQSLGPSRRLIA